MQRLVAPKVQASSLSLSDSSASRSSWQKLPISPVANVEQLEHRSQSSIETEEDVADPSRDGKDAKVGCTKGGSTSSFSLCDSSASSSSWHKLSLSPVANVERLELTQRKKGQISILRSQTRFQNAKERLCRPPRVTRLRNWGLSICQHPSHRARTALRNASWEATS